MAGMVMLLARFLVSRYATFVLAEFYGLPSCLVLFAFCLVSIADWPSSFWMFYSNDYIRKFLARRRAEGLGSGILVYRYCGYSSWVTATIYRFFFTETPFASFFGLKGMPHGF